VRNPAGPRTVSFLESLTDLELRADTETRIHEEMIALTNPELKRHLGNSHSMAAIESPTKSAAHG
jgi:hypothetical protein